MTNPIQLGIRVSVDGQTAVPDIERIGNAGTAMAGKFEQAGQVMEAALNTGAAAASRTSQAMSSLGESEDQAAERIRAMVAASLQQTSALDENARATEQAAATVKRAADENTNFATSLAAVNAQMHQGRTSAQSSTSATSSDEAQKYVAALQRQYDQLGKNAAELAEYEAKMQGGSKAVQAQAYAIAANTEALRGQIAAEERSGQAADNFLAKLREQTSALGLNKTQLLEQKAAQLGVSDAAAPMIAKLGSATGHMDGFSLSSVGARRELLVLAHEMSQGNFQKFGGSMLVLGEQTGAAGLLFSGTGLAILGVGAAVAGVGYAMIKGANEQKKMDDALIMTGNYAGLTGDSLNQLAHDAVASGGSIGEAKKVATELAASGKFTGDQIGYITESVVGMEHAAGVSVEKTIKQFESLAVQSQGSSARASEAVSRATLKLDDEYHFLTEAVYEQIRALEKEGDAKGASRLATESFAAATKARSEEIVQNLGSIAKGWNTVKEVIGAANDALGNYGKRATPASDVNKYSTQLKNFDDGINGSNERLGRAPGAMSADLDAARTKIVLNLTDAVDKLNKADAEGIAQSKAKIAQSEGEHAASRILADDQRLQKKGMSELKIALAEYADDVAKVRAANPNSALVSDEAVDAHIAAITKAHSAAVKGNDDRAKLLQDARVIEQTALDREKNIYDEREKMLTLYHSKMGLSDADFYAGREAARNEYIAAEAASFARWKAMIESTKPRTAVEIATQKETYDALLKQHLEFTDKMRAQRGEDSATALAGQKKSYDDIIKAIQTTGVADDKRLDDAITKQREHNAEIGKTKSQIELVRKAAEDLATTQMQSDADFIRNALLKGGMDAEAVAAYEMRLSYLDGEIKKRQELSGLLQAGASLEAVSSAKKELDKLFDPTKVQSFGDSLRGALGAAGDSMTKLIATLGDYGTKEAQIAKARGEAKVAYANDAAGMAAINAKINESELKGQLSVYSGIAGAAKGFFSDQSKGYKALQAAEQGFRAVELAMAISNMVAKSGLVTAFTGLFVAGKASETAASVASVAPDVAASMAKGTAAAAVGVASQAQGDPYSAFPRMAAMAALMVALGFAVSGGGGGGVDVAKERQAAAGKGTVLGDANAKSDSIANSLTEISKTSSLELSNTAGMLRSLQNIENSISGLGNLVARQLNITSPTGGTAVGFDPNSVGTVVHALFGGNSVTEKALAKIPVVGELLSGLMSTVGNFISKGFGTKTSLVDSGIYAGQQSLGSIQSSGLNASAYADIENTKKFLWVSYSKSTETQFSALGSEVTSQLSLVVNNLAAGTKAATGLLGITGSQFTDQMKNFVVDLGKISLKGLTGDEIQKQFETIFSALGDKMAMAALPGLESFQKVGEGYFETLNRIATDYANVDSILSSVNMTFGAVGVSSVAARERLIDFAGGIDNLSQLTSSYARDFLTDAERLAPVTKYVGEQMAALGLAGVTTREQFKQVAEGLDKTTEAGAAQFAAMLKLEGAFAQVYPAVEATANAAKSAADVLSERKELQDQLDQLTLTSAQLLLKQRDAYDASNLALFDQIQAITAANAAKEAADAEANSLLGLQAQLYALTGNAAGAAAVMEKQHAAALLSLSPALEAATKELWAEQAATAAKATALAESNSLLALQAQLYAVTGDAAGAAAVLEKQHAAALLLLSPALQAATKELWSAQAAADAIKKAQESAAAAESTRLQNVATARSALTSAYQTEASALASTISQAQEFIKTLRSFSSALLLGDLSTLSPAEKYAEAKRQFESATPENLQSASTAFLQASKEFNASSPQYAQDLALVQKSISHAADAAAAQISVAQQQLSALDASVNGLVDVKNAVLSVRDALTAYQAAVDGKPAAISGTNTTSNAWNGQGVLMPDGSIWDSYTGFHMNPTAAQVANANRIDGSHAGGLEAVPFDGYRAELHEGEGVIDAPAMSVLRRYFNAPTPPGASKAQAAEAARVSAATERQNGLLETLIQKVADGSDSSTSDMRSLKQHLAHIMSRAVKA